MLPGLKVVIEADTTKFSEGVGAAQKKLSRFQASSDRAARGLKNFGDSATKLGKKMSVVSGGVIAGAIGMFALAKGTATAGDRIAKTARSTGVGAEAFQELSFAIGQATDVSEEKLAVSLTRLTRRMGEAADGNKALVEAFEKIGVSAEDIRSGAVDTEEAFMMMVSAMQAAETDAEAASVAMELMGREGASLALQLRESGADIDELRQKAQDLGIVMDNETAAASERFIDKMDDLGRQFEAVKWQIGNALIPVMIDFMDTIQEKVLPGIQSFIGNVTDMIDWFRGLPEPVQEAAALIAGALGTGGPVLLAIGAMSKAISALILATGPVGLFIAAATTLWMAWKTWGDDIKALLVEVKEFFVTKFNEIIEFLESLPEKFMEFGRNIVQGLLDGINEQWEKLKERIAQLGELLPQWLRDKLGIASPSKVMHTIGMQIGEGLASGIAQTQAMAEKALGATADSMENTALGAAKGVLGAMSTLFDNSKPIAAAQALINTWQGMTEALKLPFPKNLAAAATVLAQGLAAVKSIRSTTKSGGGGGASAGGGGAANAGTIQRREPAPPTTDVNINLRGDTFSRQSVLALIGEINDAVGDGARIRTG